MIGRFRSDGTVEFANKAYARICGLPAEGARGANLYDHLPRAQSHLIKTQLARLNAKNTEIRFEEFSEGAEGPRWMLWKYYGIEFDQRGEWREVEVIGIDITKSKRDEQELLAVNARLRQTERHLQRAQAIAQIGSWHYNGPQNKFVWSPETYRIFAMPESTPVDLEIFLAAVHPLDRDAVEAAWLGALKNKTDHDVEHRIIANGEVKWVHERASLEWDENGELLEAYGTCRDTTLTKAAEARLRRSEERFGALVKASSEVVICADPSGRIIGELDLWKAYSGQSLEQCADGGWMNAIFIEDRAAADAAWAKAVQSGEPYSMECRLLGGDHVLRWVRWTCVPVRGKSGAIEELVGMFSDITQQKQLEHDLEARVIQRTAALNAAREAAVRASAEKSEFLRAASHDLRQPLHAAALYISALERRIQDQSQRLLCEKAGQSIDATSEMLRVLLDVSRFESGAVTPEARAFSVQDLIDRVLDNNRMQADKKGLTLINTPTDCVAFTDPGLLERVVDNFVSNAVRYTNPGGSITLACTAREKALRLSVSDTGIGIPSDALGKIFDEYVQLDNPARDRANGLGLGLAIARHIATLLGCRLDATSTVGEGSTFSVEMAAGVKSSALGAATGGSAPRALASRCSLLFIEDDPVVADAVTLVLQDAGFAVAHAANGDEALAALHAGLRPELIVSDFRLPRENGLDVIRKLRGALNSDVPVLLATGDPELLGLSAGQIENCIVAHKPINSTDLVALLCELGVGAPIASAVTLQLASEQPGSARS